MSLQIIAGCFLLASHLLWETCAQISVYTQGVPLPDHVRSAAVHSEHDGSCGGAELLHGRSAACCQVRRAAVCVVVCVCVCVCLHM